MLALSKAGFSVLICAAATWASPTRVTSPQHDNYWSNPSALSSDQSSAQAAFKVPCHGCLGGLDDDDLFFDFQTFPTSQPCGGSILRLNGLDLAQDWHSTHANGSGSLSFARNSRVRDVDLTWETNCLTGNTSLTGVATDDSALVLTVTISKADARTPKSLSGFTASFKQYPVAELLRLDLTPISPAPQNPAEDWRNPPSHLRLGQLLSSKHRLSSLIRQGLAELDSLKGSKRELEQLIEDKEKEIQAHLQAQGQDIEYELGNCDTFDCAFDAISQRVKNAFNFLYYRITSYHWDQATLNDSPSGHIPDPNMHSEQSTSVIPTVESPAPVHLSSSTPSSWGGSYEKLPDVEEEELPRYRPRPQNHRRRSPFMAVLQFVLVVFGLSALFAFIRRRCASLRTRTERAASREERRNRRAYRRAARRAAWKNWWRSGWGRRRDQERRTDYEEKRNLIQAQESRLEVAMQAEITNLQVEHNMIDEISNLRYAHGMVDELVRAEEGRGTVARPVIIRGRMPGMASIAGIMMGQSQNLYSSSLLSGSTAISETEDGSAILTPPTSATFSRPMSRSNSLPSYRTDPTLASAPSSRYGDSDIDNRSLFSDPPAYQTDPEDSDDEVRSRGASVEMVTNGMRYTPSDYAPSLLSPTDTASIFTPDSSIPDVSPRESAETVRTFM